MESLVTSSLSLSRDSADKVGDTVARTEPDWDLLGVWLCSERTRLLTESALSELCGILVSTSPPELEVDSTETCPVMLAFVFSPAVSGESSERVPVERMESEALAEISSVELSGDSGGVTLCWTGTKDRLDFTRIVH